MINFNIFKYNFDWKFNWNKFIKCLLTIGKLNDDILYIVINNKRYIPWELANGKHVVYDENKKILKITIKELIIKILEVEEYNLRIEQYIFENII